MGKVCDRCEALYVRLSNAGSGVLANPWATVWRDSVAACGCRNRGGSSWFVVHPETDTVLAASECQAVDLSSEGVQLALESGLTGDDYRDDITVMSAADSFGFDLGGLLAVSKGAAAGDDVRELFAACGRLSGAAEPSGISEPVLDVWREGAVLLRYVAGIMSDIASGEYNPETAAADFQYWLDDNGSGLPNALDYLAGLGDDGDDKGAGL